MYDLDVATAIWADCVNNCITLHWNSVYSQFNESKLSSLQLQTALINWQYWAYFDFVPLQCFANEKCLFTIQEGFGLLLENNYTSNKGISIIVWRSDVCDDEIII